MGYSIYHQFSVRLLYKSIFPFFGLYFRVLTVLTRTFFCSSGRLLKNCIFISTFISSHFWGYGWRSTNSLVTVIFRLVLGHIVIRAFYWSIRWIRWIIVVIIGLLRNIRTQIGNFLLLCNFRSLIGVFRGRLRIFWNFSLAFSRIVAGPRVRTFTLFLFGFLMLR